MSTGYSGELYFFELLQSKLHCNPILLFDLLLKVNSSECQIDCLLIFQNECILIEVKNYRGDFFIENNDWYMLSKEGVKNPLYQLQRTELLLKKFFKQHKIPLNIRSFIVFTHPEFQLYQAPLNIPVVFPTQLKRFIRKLQNIPCNIHKQHHDIAVCLKSKHLLTSAYEMAPVYDYDQLNKGVTCGRCDEFMEINDLDGMCCATCKSIDSFSVAIMRNVYDFHLLFPEKKITVATIAEWANNQISKHRIRKVLSRHCLSSGKGRSSHYLLNNRI